MSSPQSAATVEQLWSHVYELLNVSVTASYFHKSDCELIQILSELLRLGPGNDQHPAVQYMFDWLEDPECPAEEFQYIVGPLGKHVDDIMVRSFGHEISEQFRVCSYYLAKVAIEALVVRSPILEGDWETVALFVIRLVSPYRFLSDDCKEWVFRMSTDAELCPNPFLRLQLLGLLPSVLDYNEHDRNRALEVIMSQLSSLNLNPTIDKYGNDKVYLCLDAISQMLAAFVKDEVLVWELKSMENYLVSCILDDVSFQCSQYPSRYAEPMTVQVLTGLLRTIAKYARLELIELKENHLYPGPIIALAHVLEKTLFNFPRSCQMSRMIPETASCLVNVLEVVLVLNASGIPVPGDIIQDALDDVQDAIDHLYTAHIEQDIQSETHVLKEIVRKYKSRLVNLRKLLTTLSQNILDIQSFPMINELLLEKAGSLYK